MDYSALAISVAAIDENDRRFLISTRENDDDLLESIEIIGLIHPPVLLQTGNDRYCIISGRRRISACKQAGFLTIPARILSQNTSFGECATLAVAENSLQRPLNMLEQARAYRLLSEPFENEHERFRMYRALGLPHHAALVAKIKRINSFPPLLQSFLLKGSIPLPIAILLDDLPQTSGLFLARLFDELKLGLNKQREILLIASEIAAREDIDLMDIFNQAPLNAIIDSADLECSRKTQKIRDYLRKRRYPHIAAAEIEIMECLKELPLRDDIRLSPPPHFEGTTYTLTLEFNNMDELKTAYSRMNDIMRHSSLTKIMNMVSKG